MEPHEYFKHRGIWSFFNRSHHARLQSRHLAPTAGNTDKLMIVVGSTDKLGATWDVGDFHPLKAPFDMAEASTIQNSKLATFELYNLVDDIHQDRDLADEYPARLDAMKSELIRLHGDVMRESRLRQKQ